MNEALRDWVTNVDSTFYLIGTVAGPAPIPGDGARLPGGDRQETRTQLQARGRLPDSLVACIGGGSNAMNHPFWMAPALRSSALKPQAMASKPASTPPASNGGVPGVLHGNHLLLGRRRPDHRRPLDFRRPGLPRHRPGTRLVA